MTATVSIIGSALSGNKGAAAMLEAAVEGISRRLPDVRFVLFSMYPGEDSRLNRYPNLEIIDASPLKLGVIINSLALLYRLLPPLRSMLRRRSRAIRALTSSCVLLDQGGITFSDGREKFLLYNVASILPAMFVGLPVVKCAQAVGPFTSPVNRFAASIFLPRLRLIVTRGRITHSLAEAMQLPNIRAGADLAFTLPGTMARHDNIAGSPTQGRVAVSPSAVLQKKVDSAGGDYAAEMAHFVSYLVNSGKEVVLFPHSARSGTDATHNNDLPLCRSIFVMLAPDIASQVEFVETEHSSQELRALIASCDVLVTSRFHAMVSGLATATPTLVIGWSHKYEEVLEMFNAAQWAFPHNELSQALLRSRFEELWTQRDEVAAQIASNLPNVRAKADEQLDAIAQLVDGSTRPTRA